MQIEEIKENIKCYISLLTKANNLDKMKYEINYKCDKSNFEHFSISEVHKKEL